MSYILQNLTATAKLFHLRCECKLSELTRNILFNLCSMKMPITPLLVIFLVVQAHCHSMAEAHSKSKERIFQGNVDGIFACHVYIYYNFLHAIL